MDLPSPPLRRASSVEAELSAALEAARAARDAALAELQVATLARESNAAELADLKKRWEEYVYSSSEFDSGAIDEIDRLQQEKASLQRDLADAHRIQQQLEHQLSNLQEPADKYWDLVDVAAVDRAVTRELDTSVVNAALREKLRASEEDNKRISGELEAMSTAYAAAVDELRELEEAHKTISGELEVEREGRTRAGLALDAIRQVGGSTVAELKELYSKAVAERDDIQEKYRQATADLDKLWEARDTKIAELQTLQERHDYLEAELKIEQDTHNKTSTDLQSMSTAYTIAFGELRELQEAHNRATAELSAATNAHTAAIEDLEALQWVHNEVVDDLNAHIAAERGAREKMVGELEFFEEAYKKAVESLGAEREGLKKTLAEMEAVQAAYGKTIVDFEANKSVQAELRDVKQSIEHLDGSLEGLRDQLSMSTVLAERYRRRLVDYGIDPDGADAGGDVAVVSGELRKAADSLVVTVDGDGGWFRAAVRNGEDGEMRDFQARLGTPERAAARRRMAAAWTEIVQPFAAREATARAEEAAAPAARQRRSVIGSGVSMGVGIITWLLAFIFWRKRTSRVKYVTNWIANNMDRIGAAFGKEH